MWARFLRMGSIDSSLSHAHRVMGGRDRPRVPSPRILTSQQQADPTPGQPERSVVASLLYQIYSISP